MTKKRFFFKYVMVYAIVLVSLLAPTKIFANNSMKTEHFVMHHVADAHDWHFSTLGKLHITLPLPVIIYSKAGGLTIFSSTRFLDKNYQKVSYRGYVLDDQGKIKSLVAGRVFYDLSITKNVAGILLSIGILLIVLLTVAKRYIRSPQKAPYGLWAVVEMITCFIRDDIAIPNIGPKKYERFMPYLLTVFCFIWLNNLMGLLPGAANVTGNISVTLVLALFTFFITNKNGNKHYWQHLFNPSGIPKWIFPIMLPVEILGLFTKPFALMVRLFANITAGHIILLSIIGLIFIFQNIFVAAISVPFATFMFLLKLIVAFLQAYVFTLLSAIYFGAAVGNAHDTHKDNMCRNIRKKSYHKSIRLVK